ncbi:MAG: FliH/SctL family protein [Chloroflexota bacterium]
MGTVVIKAQRRKKKVKILVSQAAIDEEWRRLSLTDFAPRQVSLDEEGREEPPKPVKSVFTEIFTISDSNQPIEISLRNVERDALALEEVRETVQKAYDEGFRDGQHATQSVMASELEAHQEWVRRIDQVAEELKSNYYESVSRLSDTVIDLAMKTALYILRAEASESSRVVLEQARRAIEAADEDEIIRICAHPDDVEILTNSKSALTSDSSRIERVVVAGDDSILPGGCVVITAAGAIDARLDYQLSKLALAMKKEMEK